MTNRCRQVWVRLCWQFAVFALIATCSGPANARAQDAEPVLKREDSAWARFPVGAWRKDEIRVFRQDPQTGNMTSGDVTTVTSTLVEILNDHYVLRVERSIARDGRIMTPDPTEEKRFFDDTAYDKAAAQTAKLKPALYSNIDDKPIQTRSFRRVRDDESVKLVVTSVYADLADPRFTPGNDTTYSQLIHRKTERTIKANEPSTTVVEWNLGRTGIATISPPGVNWMDESFQHQTNSKGEVEWKQTSSPFVPGGLVESLATEWSTKGQFQQGTEFRLLQFGLEPEQRESSQETPGQQPPGDVAGADAPARAEHPQRTTPKYIAGGRNSLDPMFTPAFSRPVRWRGWMPRRGRNRRNLFADGSSTDVATHWRPMPIWQTPPASSAARTVVPAASCLECSSPWRQGRGGLRRAKRNCSCARCRTMRGVFPAPGSYSPVSPGIRITD
ncbi:MAG: hypothetical protein MPJ50_15035 [Pirellulales bacterium]|nr:hypothetical protein [Pirellulales bacterium]